MDALLKMFQLTESDVMMIPIGAILFVVFWKSFERILIAPFLRLIEAREEATTGAQTEVKEITEKVSEIQQSVEDRLMNARIEAMRLRLAKVNEAKKSATTIAESAEQEIAKTLDEARARIAKEIENTRAQSSSHVDRMAEDAATLLLKEGQRSVIQ